MMGARERIRMVVEEQAREEIGDLVGCSVTRKAMERIKLERGRVLVRGRRGGISILPYMSRREWINNVLLRYIDAHEICELHPGIVLSYSKGYHNHIIRTLPS
jgi:hypothetical protein